ncbi:hypothetical protein FJK98_02475 [Micromonospora sp. HM134]|uniref:hypothetical protein n=1 Tax=Micromonospora sp. HM134 TaxID=2583243 RepID=UPI0011988B97|nr:hypothetical protein [Micromonospora sp. HM134]QDY06167.1 hypothetical protein FJK98_02475 [Micromonospora sp. HM134]
MALYTHAVGLSAAGSYSTPAAVASSDTISAADIGTRGALLRVICGATPANVTVVDPGTTPSGNAGSPSAVAVSASSARNIYVSPAAVNPSTQVATVNYSATSSVTCELYRL